MRAKPPHRRVFMQQRRDSARRAILTDPPDVLLTTPESLEVMLVTPRVEHQTLFSGIQAVVIDEVHAFAGDDRGWHLLAVLERIMRLAGRDIQRVGLSATVGNPDELLEWQVGSSKGPRQVVSAPQAAPREADVQLDYVGSTENAATVIARLHQGEKRLVFCDSRAGVEELAAGLVRRSVNTFVSHSSLSVDQRCFRHQLLLPRPYLVLTKPLRLDIQCQRAASVKIGWKYLDD